MTQIHAIRKLDDMGFSQFQDEMISLEQRRLPNRIDSL